MATSIAHDTTLEDWAEPQALPDDEPTTARDEWLWALISIALLVVLIAFVVDDHPLRTVLPTN